MALVEQIEAGLVKETQDYKLPVESDLNLLGNGDLSVLEGLGYRFPNILERFRSNIANSLALIGLR